MDIMQKHEQRTIAAAPTGPQQAELPFHRRLWKAWIIVGHKIGTFNSRVILTLFYVLIMIPYSLVMFPFADLMRMKSRQTWIKRETRDKTLADAVRQA